MAQKKKRRLTKEEVEQVRKWMDSAPQGQKPTVRKIARRYGVNQPSVVKSLGGWKGIHRGRPSPPPRTPKVIDAIQKPIKIEPHTFGSDGLAKI